METNKLPNVNKHWVKDGYLNIELIDGDYIRLNFNDVKKLKEQLALLRVVKSFYCRDEKYHKIDKCKTECENCKAMKRKYSQ